eukprot:6679413-Prymnesium_polylepis.1
MLWSARERVGRARKRKDKIVRTWLSQGRTMSGLRSPPGLLSFCVETPETRSTAVNPRTKK